MDVDVGAQPHTVDELMDQGEWNTSMADEAAVRAQEDQFLEEHQDFIMRNSSYGSCVVPDKEEAEKLNDEPASPIRTEWPADSLLKPEHFTIDQQRCLHCNKELGYAMPMNRLPKVKYLFCDQFECQNTQLIHCWACGHFTSENEGHLVNRPGNSAYHGPSAIFSYMCKSCYKDQLELEPGLEETREMYKKYRELRKESEEKEKAIAELALQDSSFDPNSFTYQKTGVHPSTFRSSLSGDAPKKRKRDDDPGEVELP